MLSKNNNNLWNEKMEPKKQRFAIKKFTVGVASVLIGTTFAFYSGGNNVSADASINSGADAVKETVTDASDSEKIKDKEVTLSDSGQNATTASSDVTGDLQTDSSNESESTAAPETPVAEESKSESDASSSTVADTSGLEKTDAKEETSSVSEQNTTTVSSDIAGDAQTAGSNNLESTASSETQEAKESKSEPDALTPKESSHLEEERSVTVSLRALTAEANSRVGEGTGILVDQKATADPAMSDPNGARVENVTPPTGYAPTAEAGWYTFTWGSLTSSVKADAYFRYSLDSDPTTSTVLAELVQKSTGARIASKKIDLGTKEIFFSGDRGENISISYDASNAVDGSLGTITLSSPGNVWAANLVPGYGTYTTYYKTEDGKELARYEQIMIGGQTVEPSGKRDFKYYDYVKTIESASKIGLTPGTTYLDGSDEKEGMKRIAIVQDEDGTLKKELWYKNPDYTGAVDYNSPDTNGFIKILETSDLEAGNGKFNFNESGVVAATHTTETLRIWGTDQNKVSDQKVYTFWTSADGQYKLIGAFSGTANHGGPFGRFYIGKVRYLAAGEHVTSGKTGVTFEGPGWWYPDGDSYGGQWLLRSFNSTAVNETTYVYTFNGQKAIVRYVDANKNNEVITTSGDLIGKAGEAIDYSTAETIANLEKKGYVLISNGFPAGAKYDNDDNKTQVFDVVLGHGVQPVTPTTPPEDVPDKTPNNARPDALTKDVTLNVNYVNSDGSTFTGTIPTNAQQKLTFNGLAYISKVTGQLVNAKQDANGQWIVDTANQATPEITWTPTDGSFSAVISPAERGYHVESVSSHKDGDNVAAISGITKDSSNITITVTYAKNGTGLRNEQTVTASQIVKYVYEDENGKQTEIGSQPTPQTFEFRYSGDTYDLVTNELISRGTWNATSHDFDAENVPVITGYVAVRGYSRAADGTVTAGGFTTTQDASEAQRNRTFIVVYKKVGNIVPQDPSGNPIPDPSNPGTNVPNEPYKNDPTDPTKVTPDEPVPTIDGYTPSQNTVTPPDPTKDIPVIYVKAEQAKVQYIDLDDNNRVMSESPTLTGKAGEKINYSTATEIADYVKAGYVLVNDGFSDNPVFDNVDGNEQVFKVTFRHGQLPVGPDTPDKHGVDPDQLTKNVKETVHYVGAGDKTPADKVQTSKWTRTVTVDAVTGKVIEKGQYTTNWSIVSGEKTIYDQVDTPVVEGYHADKRQVNATAVTQDDIEVTVTYAPNGKLIPVDPDGNPIPDAPTPQYPTDPTDPTKVTPTPVPDIPNYKPENPNPVTPPDPGKDTPVPYVPVEQQVAQIVYRDVNDPAKIVTIGEADKVKGDAGSVIVYNPQTRISELENKGYVLKNNGFPEGAVFDNDDGKTQIFYIDFVHGTVPVNPDQPGPETPGQPINPNDPDGPKYPDGTAPNALTKNVTRTIKYVDDKGTEVRASVEQTVKFTASGVLDKVTGEWITPLTWTSAQSINEVKSPVVPGYHLVSIDKDQEGNNVKGVTLEHTDDSYTVTVTYAPNGKLIPVDPDGNPIPNVPTPQYPTDPTDPSKVTPTPVPNVPGYEPDNPNPVTPTDPGKDTPVPYHPITPTPVNDQKAVVRYVDANKNNEVITTSGDLTGKAGEAINYSTAETIANLEKKGYVLISDGFPAGATYDNDDNTTQVFTVVLGHGTRPVTPTDPGKPDQPINPDDPDGPKYPDGSDQVTKNVTRTINYVDEQGNKVSDSVEQTINFTAQGVLDKVTGEWITPLTWSQSQTINGVKSPVVPGYHLVSVDKDQDGNNVAGVTLTHENDSYTVTVTYAPNGKLIPVDPDGNPIPNVPTPQYPTDPTDPSKVTPTPVPNVPGYEPDNPNPVTPTDPGKDTPVPYHPVTPTPVNDQKAVVRYVDANKNNEVITTSGDLTGKAGEAINYSTAETIANLEKKGYVLISDGFPAGATYDNDDNTTQVFTVVLGHGTQPVTPTDPGKPDQPINPDDPDGPKYPDGSDQVTKNVTRTINYVDEQGNKVSDSVEQTINFTAQGVLDKVTGEWITPLTWSQSQTINGVKSPVVPGYHLVSVDKDQDGNNVAGVTLTHENDSYTVTVTYAPNGKLIPVDPDGNPIPNVPTPQYPTDPTDPSKVTPTPVPNVPGYEPDDPNPVTPTDPGKDTPVPYHPVVEDKYSLTERFVDEEGTELSSPVTKGTDYKEGTEYDVTGDAKVINGYYLIKTSDNAKGKFGKDNVTVTFTYAKLGKIVPVDPNGKPIPDAPTPQYPNDPTDPSKTVPNQPVPEIPGYRPEVPTVTPDKPGEDTPVTYVPVVEDKYSLTERFVDEEGTELSASVTKGTDYKEGTEYDVTGDAKVINGYYLKATPDNAKGKFGKDNVTVTFTYAKLGKVVPVDPNGKPIPDAPTPQYPNDPTDPSKTVPNQPVPEIPGYRPEVPSVTPDKPGEDTPVIYVPVVEDKYSLTERFVDEEGNELSASVTKGTDYKEGTEYDVTGDAKVINGYYLKATSDNAKGTFGKDNVTVTFTYAKLGKIVPVDPNGKPIPDAPTPQYPNDPTDPSKTVPNQPVPEIPGYRPEVPSVTPDKPGEDTPVIYVPVVEDKYSLTERFVDEEGNELSASVTKGTDYKEGTEYDVTGDAKVINGYYLIKTSDNAKGKFGKDNVTVTFTYAKLGKIVPVDPNGNPIPNVPTPQYPNDPTDPSKTVPNQPVPEIPGYRPEVPTVTPEKPGEDTPVIYVPVTPEKPGTPENPGAPEKPENQETPEAPKATPVNNVQTPVKEPAKSPVASEGENKANELPQTGDEQNNTLAAVGASIIAVLLGIIGFAKKKDDEKEN